MSMNNILGHLKTVLTHKYYVFKYMTIAGYPIRGFMHDMSKFSWTEFSESVKYYTGTISPITVCKKTNGCSYAWQHHKGRNPHHYEYWVDYLDDGGIPIKMPYKYVIELICDYIAAGKAYRKEKFTFKDEYSWWETKLINEHPKIHKDTIDYISLCLRCFAEKESFDPEVFKTNRKILNY